MDQNRLVHRVYSAFKMAAGVDPGNKVGRSGAQLRRTIYLVGDYVMLIDISFLLQDKY